MMELRLPTEHQLEDRFTQFVRAFGGEHVGDLFASQASKPTNADYFLWDRSVVAELKTITSDRFSLPSVGKKMGAMLQAWAHGGVLGPEQVSGRFVSTRGLAPRYANEALDIMASKLIGIVRDAAHQIELTKRHFKLPNAKGLVLLANIGDRSLSDPEHVEALLRRAFRNRRHVDSFVFFSPALDLSKPGEADLWMQGCTSSPERGVSEDLLEELGARWNNFNPPPAGAPAAGA